MNINQLAIFVVDSVNLTSPPRSIESILCEILKQDLPEITAIERAAELSPRVLARLNRIYRQAVEQGEEPKYTFNSSSSYHIQGLYFNEPRDSEDVKAVKRARSQCIQIMAAIHKLTFSEFELLCSRVLQELGASQVVRTPRAEDQGIDFYGKLNLGDLAPNFPFLRLEDSITLWLIGQAKHYPNRSVQVFEVRELAGSILLARHKEYTVKDIYPDLLVRSCDPLVGLFITSGKFTKGSRRIGIESGIVCKDGNQLSAFLADRQCGFIEASGGLVFSEQAFQEWLRNRGEE